MHRILATVAALLLTVTLVTGCAQAKDPSNWKNTTEAGARAALDFSDCEKTALASFASQGAEAFTMNAIAATAESCGIRDIPDGFAILVALYRDVKAMIEKSHAPPAPPPEVTP